jgi:hypothetical protein
MNAWGWGLLLLGLGGMGLGSVGLIAHRSRPSSPSSLPLAVSATPAARPQHLEYKVFTLPSAIVHTLTISPNSGFLVVPAIAPTTATVEAFAQTHPAIAVLNAGFFDPQNQQTTSFVTIGGQLVADPRQNDRLMQNPKLTRYLDRILDRAEFRHYQCGQTGRYDITAHSQAIPPGCQLRDAIGAGPQLLPQDTSQAEGFVAITNGESTRDALGSTQPNARTAIGLKPDGTIVWVMAAQKSENPTQSGLTLAEMTEFLQSLGIDRALNLDGGSSSSLYYGGNVYYGKLDQAGKPVRRSVKSVLLIQAASGFH